MCSSDLRNVEFRLQPFKKGTWRTFTTEQGLPNNEVKKIVEGADGGLWISTDAGVCYFDGNTFQNRAEMPSVDSVAPKRKEIVSWKTEGDMVSASGRIRRTANETTIAITAADGFPSRVPRGLTPTADGVVWTRNITGMSRYDERTWRQFTKRDGLPSSFLWNIRRASDQTLWMTFSSGGVCHYDGTNFISYIHPNEVPEGSVRSAQAGTNGVMWFATQKGLLKLNPLASNSSPDRWRLYGKTEGLENEIVLDIQRLADNDLWLLTAGGLARFDGIGFTNVVSDRAGSFLSRLATAPGGSVWFGASEMNSSGARQFHGTEVTAWSTNSEIGRAS